MIKKFHLLVSKPVLRDHYDYLSNFELDVISHLFWKERFKRKFVEYFLLSRIPSFNSKRWKRLDKTICHKKRKTTYAIRKSWGRYQRMIGWVGPEWNYMSFENGLSSLSLFVLSLPLSLSHTHTRTYTHHTHTQTLSLPLPLV